MLKERINFLLDKKGMSRKELVSGLITLPHFSNILKGRYILAEDLASKFAEKLEVPADYLLKAEDISNHILQGANDIVNQMIVFIDIDETYVTTLPNCSNPLVIELTSKLMAACYYQSIGDNKNYAFLHKNYLNFYLKEFSDDDIKDLPSPLKKAFYFYKIQVFRSKNDFELAYSYCKLLLPLLTEDVEPWLAVKKIEVEILLTLRKFEVAKKSLDEAMQKIQLKNLNYHLPSFYVLQSNYYFYLGFSEEALISLSKAEENVAHLDLTIKGTYLITIFNNRIVMLIKTGKLVEAESESERFNTFLQHSSEVEETFFTLIKIYRADIALLGKQFDRLDILIEELEKLPKNSDQGYALRFYKAMLAISNGDYQLAEEEAESCIMYFEENPIIERLVPLYETLGICAEKKRQYKKSSDMYKKIVYLLKEG
ncbi:MULTISPECIES: helix-turn-helix domain-containing protein [Listeria]|uniref:helix-turn-helix domain-containing protein n=1 Tax=Listeria TaxID=1637 RepID=UPI000B5957CA|nr:MULTISPECIES: helix-turn-helix transcriptional regulator [Listeria]